MREIRSLKGIITKLNLKELKQPMSPRIFSELSRKPIVDPAICKLVLATGSRVADHPDIPSTDRTMLKLAISGGNHARVSSILERLGETHPQLFKGR